MPGTNADPFRALSSHGREASRPPTIPIRRTIDRFHENAPLIYSGDVTGASRTYSYNYTFAP